MTGRRTAAVATLLSLLVGQCSLRHIPEPVPPPPKELELAATPGAVVAVAAEILQRLGWTVTDADTLRRREAELRAEHTARGDGNGDWMACENRVGERGDRRRATLELTSTVAVQVRAAVAATGSRVRIHATVPQAYSPYAAPERGPMLYVNPRCVSSGGIEVQLADSLTARLR